MVARTLRRGGDPGDEVVVRGWTTMPTCVRGCWPRRRRRDLRWVAFDPATGELTPDDVAAVVGPRNRLVAVMAASTSSVPDRTFRDRRGGAYRGARSSMSTGWTRPPTLWTTCRRPARTSGCARRTSSWGRTWACWAPGRPPGGLHPAKLLPSTDAVPDGSNWGRIRGLLADTTAAVDFLGGLLPVCRRLMARAPCGVVWRWRPARTSCSRGSSRGSGRCRGFGSTARAASGAALLFTADRVPATAIGAAPGRGGGQRAGWNFYARGPATTSGSAAREASGRPRAVHDQSDVERLWTGCCCLG